jgi:protein-S-isoprenylcysteine O-methyltransferase Ste14
MCKAEEKDLEIRYGEKYIEYKHRTGMFFPKKKI